MTVATRPFAPVALVGLAGTTVILAALAPWLLTSDEGTSAWVALAVIGILGPARLLWHRHRLRTGIGDPARVLSEAGDTVHAVTELPARNPRRGIGVLAGLRQLRALRAVLAVTGLANRARDLYGPLTPPALWLTGIATLAIVVTVAAAPVVLLASLLLALAR